MKKVYLIVWLLIMLLVTSCTNAGNILEVELINLKSGEKTVIANDSEDLKIILDALDNKERTNETVSDLTSYEVLVKKNSSIENYKLSFDLKNNSVYVSYEDKLYKLKDNSAKELFLNENFYFVYIDSTLYNSYLDYNESSVVPDIDYNWTYKNIGGHFTNKIGTLNGKINKPLVLKNNDLLDIFYEKVPDSQVIRVFSGEKLVSTGTNLEDALKSITTDGEYNVESQAQWLLKDGKEYYGNQKLKFTVNIDKPANVQIVTRENYPGNILLIKVDNLNGDETLKLNTDIVKTETEVYSYKDKYFFICPIDLSVTPGDYDLNVIVNEGTSGEYTVSNVVSVKSKSFKTQYLNVSDEMNESNNDNAAIYEFAQLVKPARTESSPEKLWEGTFIMPVDGELTTEFAEIRYVNNEQSSSRHSGLDIAAPKGTEIKAPNNGIVTFAMEGLLSPGSTVVIDHGMGLFTSYYHLDTIAVEKGQKVTKGDIIGTVGNTGFSTGPHLHYAVSIYNTYVNPYQTLSGIID